MFFIIFIFPRNPKYDENPVWEPLFPKTTNDKTIEKIYNKNWKNDLKNNEPWVVNIKGRLPISSRRWGT